MSEPQVGTGTTERPRALKFYRALTYSTFALIAATTLLLSQSKFSRAIDDLIVLHPGDKLSVITPQNKFSWDKVHPSETLVWNRCFLKYDCARLIVPLNYSEPSSEKAVIAIMRLPSPPGSPRAKLDYRGPILINPGGPGGSGVDMVRRAGEQISTIVGPQFDIVGFDPRGVGLSTPRATFFETSLERKLWDGVVPGLNVLNASSDGLARAWSRSKITGQLAWERQKDVLGHINTDQTARDMLSIVRAHGRERLSYWGFSYGSVLGSTFAAMFPDNVERLVVDGVVDIENYYQTLWSDNLLDTDKTMESFYHFCHLAGPSLCPFYAPHPSLIAANLTSLYTAIRKRPLPIITSKGGYGLLDYNRLRVTIFTSLYKPFTAFPTLANALAALARGDGVPLFEMMDTGVPPKCECDGGKADVRDDMLRRDALTTISCNDGDWVPEDFEDLEKYFNTVTEESEWMELWAGIRTACVGWPRGMSKTRFRGPFEANTSFPLLFIGNTADPVTPLWAAKKTSKGYTGSIVLTQDSPGHCSLAAPSICTASYIRDYFVKGTLPPPGTICPMDGTPFDHDSNLSTPFAIESSDTQTVFKGHSKYGPLFEHDDSTEKVSRRKKLDLSTKDIREMRDAVRKLSMEYALPTF